MFTRPSATTGGNQPILTAEHPAYSQSALLQQGQGAACFQPNSHTPVPDVHGVKRRLEVINPFDRAEKYRKTDQRFERVPLKHIGLNPKIRVVRESLHHVCTTNWALTSFKRARLSIDMRQYDWWKCHRMFCKRGGLPTNTSATPTR